MQNAVTETDNLDISIPPPSERVIEQPQGFFDFLNAVSRYNDPIKNKAEKEPSLNNMDALPPGLVDKVMTELRQSGQIFQSGRIPIVMSEQRRPGTLMMKGIHPDDIKDEEEKRKFYKRLEEELRAYALLWNETHINIVNIEKAARLALLALGADITALQALGTLTDPAKLTELIKQFEGIKDFLTHVVPKLYDVLEQVPPVAVAALHKVNKTIAHTASTFPALATALKTVANNTGSAFMAGARNVANGTRVVGRGLAHVCQACIIVAPHIGRAAGQAGAAGARIIATSISSSIGAVARLLPF